MRRGDGSASCVDVRWPSSLKMLRTFASRLWLLGWVAAWIFASKRVLLRPEIVSSVACLFGTSGVVAGLWLFVRGFQLLQRKRWVEDTPVTKIAAAAMGQVKVFGKADGPYTLLSPLAGVDCYYYRTVAWDGRNAQDRRGVNRATETLFAPFFVQDETGRLMIDPRGAELELPYEYDEAISGESMSEGARRFLRRHGLSTGGDTTVSEYAIKPGDPLLVLGTLSEKHGMGDMAAPEAGGFRATYLSRDAADLQRREQFEAMGAPTTQSAEPNATMAADFDSRPRIVLSAGYYQPFVLSRENPQRMIDDLARRSFLYIWGGPVLAVFSLGLVIRWLGGW
jgi:hypothetical protein